MQKSQRNIKYTDIGDLLHYIFPNVNDWVHNKTIPNLIVNGKKVKLRPTYRSEKLKLIILYDYFMDIPDSIDPTYYAMTVENNKYIYPKAGYRVVEIPSYLSLKKIKEEFDKKNYTFIKNTKTYKEIKSNPIVTEIDNETIHKGNTVKVLDMEFDEEIDYILVETYEIDLTQNKISIDSPIGKALLGKKVNQIIEVNVPAGTIKLKILKIT